MTGSLFASPLIQASIMTNGRSPVMLIPTAAVVFFLAPVGVKVTTERAEMKEILGETP